MSTTGSSGSHSHSVPDPDLSPYALASTVVALTARVAALEAAKPVPPPVVPPPVIVPAPYPLSLQAAIDAAAAGSTIDLTGAPVYHEQVKIAKRLTLIGVQTSGLGISDDFGRGFLVSYTDHVTLRNCVSSDWTYAGIMTLASGFVTIDGCIVRDIDKTMKRADRNAYGIVLTDQYDTRSHDSSVTGCTVSGVRNWHGLDTHGGLRIVMTDNHISNCNRGIFITDSYVGAEDVLISRNRLDTPSHGTYPTSPYNNVGISVFAVCTNVRGDSNVLDGWPSGNAIDDRQAGGPFVKGAATGTYV